MLKWLSRHRDTDIEFSAEDLSGWWIPFACLILVVGGICLATIAFNFLLSFIAAL
jgi:hypothetical protein